MSVSSNSSENCNIVPIQDYNHGGYWIYIVLMVKELLTYISLPRHKGSYH